MPITEAQKRANKKWREANKEHYVSQIKAWKESQPNYNEKNLEYIKKYQRKLLIKKEFLSLCSIF
jgi:hypothetical protein